MGMKISRRNMLKSGAAAAGLAAGSRIPEAKADVVPEYWGGDFLTQWSEPDNVERDLTPGPQPIRLSGQEYHIEPAATAGMDYGTQVRRVAEAGYTAAEGGGWNWHNASIADSEIRELQAALKQHDVYFYGLHVWVNIINPDLQQRKAAHEQTINSINMADRLGLEFILTHTGGKAAGRNKDKPHPENWTRDTWQESVQATKDILKATSGSKVALGFEAVNSCNNNTPQSHVRLQKDVGDKRVKCVLDPVNMMHPGVFYRSTELINLCFDLIGEDIVYAHAKDLQWNEMLPHYEGVVLGQGNIDYALYLAQLSRMKKPRALLIEHLPDPQMYEDSRQYMLELADTIGVKIYGA